MLRLKPASQDNSKKSEDSCIDYKNLVMCNPIKNWISKADIPILISYLDSNSTPTMPVYSTIASITIGNHGKSTLANEACHLILGYRNGIYPPYNTIPLGGKKDEQFKLEDSLKKEVLKWWDREKSN